MTKITIKDSFGEEKSYFHENLKIWRDGNTVEVYFNKPLEGGRDYRKIILAVSVNPARVDVEETKLKSATTIKKMDPFTADALEEKRPDTPEETALLEGYKAIEGKKHRKRRTKAEMDADKNNQ